MRFPVDSIRKMAMLVAVAGCTWLAGCKPDGVAGSGKIEVYSSPDNAGVLLNGRYIGETPATISKLAAGEYTIELRKEGFDRAYETIALLEGREVELNLDLMPITGLLLVTSDPAGSEVVVESQVMGNTPALITQLPLGSYDMVVRSAGLPEQKVAVELTDRVPVKVEVRHEPRVAVNSYPPGAEIVVDGELKGIAPLVLEDIPMGSHTIMAQLDQYDSQEKTVVLTAGLNDAVEFNLEKNSGTLVLDTEPALVEVFVNGTLFATTQPKEGADSISQPLRIALKAGVDHNIQLVREGYTSAALTVQTAIDQVVTRHEVLRRIFVYDTRITTKDEVIPCRLEYKLPNGNYYYERFPGVFNTARAADIIKVEPISLDDEQNAEARRLMEQAKRMAPGDL